MMNYLKKILLVVGITISFFVSLSSVVVAGGTCSAVSPTSAKFELTGCPNPGHGALRWCASGTFWWSCGDPIPYTFCNSPQFKTVLPGTSGSYFGIDSNNSSWASCSFTTPGGTVRIGTNINAPWSVWSSNGFSQSGTGSLVNFYNQLPGAYTITWGNVAGYTKTVTTQTLTLNTGLISFSNTYTPIPAITAPSVSSPTVSSITASSAILGANVTSNGGAPITARGTCWGLTPTTATTCMAEGGIALGVFSHVRTGMPAGTVIYYRGYATNSAGTAYSSPSASFTTLGVAPSDPVLTSPTATSLAASSAVLGANLVSSGGAPITARGTCWWTITNPAKICVPEGGTTTGVFSHLRTGISQGILIYHQGYATNSAGRTGYSSTGSFVLVIIPTPTLTTPTHTSITTTSAVLGATLLPTYIGDTKALILVEEPTTERGTCWGTTINPTTNCSPAGGTATGVFSHSRTGLPTGTLIYYRGYATNSAGTGYSPSSSFTTLWLDLTAGNVNPTTAITGVPTTFSSTITKNGTTGTITSFNTLFQFDDADHSTVFDSRVAVTPAINAIPSGTAVASASYIFPSAGTWWVRACADNNTLWSGTITETSDGVSGNNCGAWTPVTVNVITGTLSAPDCFISAGLNSCASNISWSITNPVPPNSVIQNGVSSPVASSGSMIRTLSFGSYTFWLYSNNGAEHLFTDFATASCVVGTSWNGSVCAVPPAFSCAGVTPSSATIYAGDDTGLIANTPKTYSITNTATKCQFSCNIGSSWNGTSCVASSCGDTFCNGMETLLTCPKDCKGKVIQF